MRFVNVKTCEGLESYVLLPDGLLPLKLLPETLRKLSRRDFAKVVLILKENGARQAAEQTNAEADFVEIVL